MKKYLLLIASLILTLVIFLYYKQTPKQITPSTDFITTLTIDYGNENINTYEVQVNSTSSAYSILKETLEKENIYYEVQQYDFGVFVKKIGSLESGAKKSWIYYVNSVSGDKAADLYILKEGDTVLWKYETPKY